MSLRDRLVTIALEWEREYTVAPPITSTLSEYDAAKLLGCTDEDFKRMMVGQTAVTKGKDFEWEQHQYQIKANRPSGRRGSDVTLVSKVKNFNWDFLIWILYNQRFEMLEAWKWSVDDYRENFEAKKRISPDDMRHGICLFQHP